MIQIKFIRGLNRVKIRNKTTEYVVSLQPEFNPKEIELEHWLKSGKFSYGTSSRR